LVSKAMGAMDRAPSRHTEVVSGGRNVGGRSSISVA
jgi:hypothetical protein